MREDPDIYRTLQDALVKCGTSGPVKIDQSICNDELFQTNTNGGKKQQNLCKGKKCAEWKDGECYLNVEASEKVARRMAQVMYGFIGI
jgi:hypothetical protein